MARDGTSAPRDCVAGLWPFALPEISPLAGETETGNSEEGSVQAVLVTQVCPCGVYPINVRGQSQSSRDAWAGSAALLRHPPCGRQRAPFQKHEALENWVSGELGGREITKSSGLGI